MFLASAAYAADTKEEKKAEPAKADAKAKAAERWAAAVTRLGQYGPWRYLLVTDPGRLGLVLNAFTDATWDASEFELT